MRVISSFDTTPGEKFRCVLAVGAILLVLAAPAEARWHPAQAVLPRRVPAPLQRDLQAPRARRLQALVPASSRSAVTA